jgi:hypothetical protein
MADLRPSITGRWEVIIAQLHTLASSAARHPNVTHQGPIPTLLSRFEGRDLLLLVLEMQRASVHRSDRTSSDLLQCCVNPFKMETFLSHNYQFSVCMPLLSLAHLVQYP